MNDQRKTPEQWFQLLKEPYRSEIVKYIVEYNKEKLFDSLLDAMYCSVLASFKDRDIIYNSLKSGETTYLAEQELKPQDMISGEWYVVDCGKCYRWLTKFREFKGNKIYNHIAFNLDDHCYCDNARMYIGYNKSNKIRPATREEVLKYFPNEFQEGPKVNTFCENKEKECNLNYCDENGCQERKRNLVEPKEVKSKLENGEWYYYSDKDGFFRRSNDLDFVLKESINNGTIYKATPIAIKILKPILEPIKN